MNSILSKLKIYKPRAKELFMVAFLVIVGACTTYQQQKTSKNVSPALASINTIFIKQVTCKALNCPGDLRVYNSIVARVLKDQSDFSVSSSQSEADGTLSVNITNYLDRSGSSWGSDKSGEISYALILNAKSSGSLVWGEEFSNKDIAVSDNLFKIRESSFSWQTTPELFEESLRRAMKKLSKDRQSLFIKG